MTASQKRFSELFGADFQADFPLGEKTTLRSGGRATGLVEIDSTEKGLRLLSELQREPFPMLVLGRGSNLLVADGDLELLVVTVKNKNGIASNENGETVFPAGTLLPAAQSHALAQNLMGMEWATGIPGTIGGAVRMNAGTKQGELKDVFSSARVLTADGEKKLGPKDLAFSYRHSALSPDEIIWDVSLSLKKISDEKMAELRESVKTYLAFRNKTQPLREANFGSTFMNPPGHHAARLIEEAGLKGKRRGNMMVSTHHANFLVNAGGGLSRDAFDLIREVQDLVKKKSGIRLRTEVCLIGF